MILEAKFNEVNSELGAEFGTVFVVEGGGGDYNKGWNDGFADGLIQGYNDGVEDGFNAGYAEGEDAGLLAGYENGYNVGYADGYNHGKAEGGGGGVNVMAYATQVTRMFNGAEFNGEELVIDMPNCPTNISEMFRVTYGLKKLTMNIPTDRTYNGSYFVYGSSTNRSTLEELTLPDGMKFSNFTNFALRCYALKTVNCGLGENGVGIDLSESTSNDSCFASCPELVEVRFKENTITKSLTFAQSADLADASITSIVNGLATVGTTQTLTVHADVAGRMSEAQKATITAKNWTLVS